MKEFNEIKTYYPMDLSDLEKIAYFKENRERISGKSFNELENSIVEKGIKMPITCIPIDKNEPDIGYWKEGKWKPWDKPFSPKLGIIEGQNRNYICYENRIYGKKCLITVDKRLTRDDIVLINNKQTPWNLYNYIYNNSQKLGGEHERFLSLVNKYHLKEGMRITAVVQALCGNNTSYKDLIHQGQNSLDYLGCDVLNFCLSIRPLLPNSYVYGKFIDVIYHIFQNKEQDLLKYFIKGLESMSSDQRDNLNFNINKLGKRKELIELINKVGKQTEKEKGEKRIATGAIKELVLVIHDNRCRSCGAHSSAHNLEIHHIKEYKNGGLTLVKNLEPLCDKPCHDRQPSVSIRE
jgi:hypothetical protein